MPRRFHPTFLHSFLPSILPESLFLHVPSSRLHSFLPSLLSEGSFLTSFTPFFPHSFLPSLLSSFTHSLIPSFLPSLLPPLPPPILPSLTPSEVSSFTPSFTQSLVKTLCPIILHLLGQNARKVKSIVRLSRIRLNRVGRGNRWLSCRNLHFCDQMPYFANLILQFCRSHYRTNLIRLIKLQQLTSNRKRQGAHN